MVGEKGSGRSSRSDRAREKVLCLCLDLVWGPMPGLVVLYIRCIVVPCLSELHGRGLECRSIPLHVVLSIGSVPSQNWSPHLHTTALVVGNTSTWGFCPPGDRAWAKCVGHLATVPHILFLVIVRLTIGLLFFPQLGHWYSSLVHRYFFSPTKCVIRFELFPLFLAHFPPSQIASPVITEHASSTNLR